MTDTRFRPALTRTLAIGASALALAASVPAYADEAGPDDIVVTAQRANRTEVSREGSLGALGNKAAEDVPFAIKSYNAALILNQQPQTLGQVLENDPSVRTTYGFGNAAEQFVIRGFELFSDDIGLDGLYGITPRQLVAPELYESVQVLNGASAFLNGAAPGGSGLGGSVNLIPKRAGEKPLTRLTANYTSNSHFGGSVDVSRRFGAGGEWGVRVNGTARSGNLATDGEFRSAYLLGGAVDYNNGPLRVSLDVAYQKIRVDRLRPKVSIGGVIPVVPEADANYGQPDSYTDLRDVFGQLKVEYDLSDNAMFYASFGARDGSEKGLYRGITLDNAATGAATAGAAFIPRTDNNEAAQAGIRVKLAAGGMTHEFNFGGSMIWQVNRNAYQFYTSTAGTNIYAPVALPTSSTVTFAGGNLADPYPISRTKLGSAFFSDTIGLWDDRILIMGGLRLQTITQTDYSAFGGAQTGQYSESAITPVIGLVIKPVPGLSLYANRIEALVRGESAPLVGPGNAPVTNAGQALPPYKSKQYEVGAKLAVGKINASLSVFQTDKAIGLLTGPNGAGAYTYGPFGFQRHRGVEFSIDGEVTEGLRVIAGGSVIDAKLRGTNLRPVGVPDYLLNGNVEWDPAFLPGITLTGRVVHTGPQAVDLANTLELPSWTRFDLGARFVTTVGDKPLTLRFGVDNVANKRYWASAFSTFAFSTDLLQGAPRTFKLSASIDM
ncbi:MAG: TonB-dependent siderophore receptor [Novosphingobium sp.]|nr:TonB-dependent siderophore receptor [Novosphingobium sp.]